MAKIKNSFQSGRFKITEFLNENKTKEGKSFESSSFQLQKSWLKENGNPKNKEDWESQSISLFNVGEIQHVVLLLHAIENKVLVKESK